METKKLGLLVVLVLLLGITGFLSPLTSFANGDSAEAATVSQPLEIFWVVIECQGQMILINPNPAYVPIGDQVQWHISVSCRQAFANITVDVPGLGYNSGAIEPPGDTPPTDPITEPGTYPYTVNGNGPNRNVAASGTIVAAGPPNPIQITFQDAAGNPYCDGLSMDHALPGGYEIAGSQCGCATGTIHGSFVGPANPVVPTGKGAIVVIPDSQIYTKLTFNPRRWAHYSYDGTPVNSGIFAIGCPAAEGGVSSLGN